MVSYVDKMAKKWMQRSTSSSSVSQNGPKLAQVAPRPPSGGLPGSKNDPLEVQNELPGGSHPCFYGVRRETLRFTLGKRGWEPHGRLAFLLFLLLAALLCLCLCRLLGGSVLPCCRGSRWQSESGSRKWDSRPSTSLFLCLPCILSPSPPLDPSFPFPLLHSAHPWYPLYPSLPLPLYPHLPLPLANASTPHSSAPHVPITGQQPPWQSQ